MSILNCTPQPRPPIVFSSSTAVTDFHSLMNVTLSAMQREERNTELWYQRWNNDTTGTVSSDYVSYTLGRLQASIESVLDIPPMRLPEQTRVAAEALINLTSERVRQVLSGQKTPVVPIHPPPEDPPVPPVEEPGDGEEPPVIPVDGDGTPEP